MVLRRVECLDVTTAPILKSAAHQIFVGKGQKVPFDLSAVEHVCRLGIAAWLR